MATTNGLILPPGVRARLVVPAANLRLADGRRLEFLGRQRSPVEVTQVAHIWEGPKKLRVLASMDETHHGDLLHVSMSYPERDPGWPDIRMVRDAFFPADTDVMMVLPKVEHYVNIHDHCFHLWQTPTAWDLM